MITTNPISLSLLLDRMKEGKIQLPDFQRGWVWDDDRIKSLLVSVSQAFPVGAIMTLSADGDVQFQNRPIEGVSLDNGFEMDHYLLDGQQRLTSLYQALRYDGPVESRDRPGGNRVIKRWYYIDMQKALAPNSDPEDAFVGVPEDKVVRTNFGRVTELDLSSEENEFREHMMPTEQIMDNTAWGFRYAQYWNEQSNGHPYGNGFEFFMKFQNDVLKNFTSYQIPVINLEKDTSKEAVCTVFEKVNTGGVTLTVFELLTATFAADGFSLRDNWDVRRKRMHSQFGVLRGVDGTNFLQAVTLLATQQRRKKAARDGTTATAGIGCKRADILALSLEEYREWADAVESGFLKTAKFLHTQFVFTQANVPYNTQIVPLAALYVELGKELETANARARLEHWYWSGVFGEMYGSAVESQYARDLPEVANYVRYGTESSLIRDANFSPVRLISLRTRLSAAYKGLYAIQMKRGASDWLTGESLTMATHIDIHHIFPKRWCRTEAQPRVPEKLYNSIINKTPIDSHTNKIIGGGAPSLYLPKLRGKNYKLESVLQSHWLNPELLESDNFAACFVERGEAMLGLVGDAMGKRISEGREVFWAALSSAGIAKPPAAMIRPETEPLEEEQDEEEEEYDVLGEAAYEEIAV